MIYSGWKYSNYFERNEHFLLAFLILSRIRIQVKGESRLRKNEGKKEYKKQKGQNRPQQSSLIDNKKAIWKIN